MKVIFLLWCDGFGALHSPILQPTKDVTVGILIFWQQVRNPSRIHQRTQGRRIQSSFGSFVHCARDNVKSLARNTLIRNAAAAYNTWWVQNLSERWQERAQGGGVISPEKRGGFATRAQIIRPHIMERLCYTGDVFLKRQRKYEFRSEECVGSGIITARTELQFHLAQLSRTM